MDGLNIPPAPRVWLPPEQPLAMLEAELGAAPPATSPPRPPGTVLWRLFVLGGAVLLTVLAVWEMSVVLGLARWTVTGVALTALFGVLFIWLALAFTNALAGCAAMITRPDPLGLLAPPGPLTARTGLLVPIHQEDPVRLGAMLAVLRAELAGAGLADRFDIFVLSDTRDASSGGAEEAMVAALRDARGPAVFYRRRRDNAGRKAGNVADWVRRFGAGYEGFVILDADSVMSAATLHALAAALERHPHVGLIQTLPLLHGGRTLFARMQGFAGGVHSPLIAAGLSLWHGAAGNYWGHNAIIRTRAFAACCGLPKLPGRKPFGGDVMSHDFVEAALLRRAGWGVHMAPFLGGSFEEGPPTLPDMAVRDRRWCQGNLQHIAIIGARGLHPLSRLHMLTGIFAYLSAPLWLLFLLLGIAVSLQAGLLQHDYFPTGHALFPTWPVVDAERALLVFSVTMVLLLAPKLLAAVMLAVSPRRPPPARLAGGTVLEILLSALLSPITMLWQTRDVVTILAGRDGGWIAQRREGGGMRWREASRYGAAPMALGAVLLAPGLLAPAVVLWMAPVLTGLLLAPVLLKLTSSERAGAALAGALMTPVIGRRVMPAARTSDVAARV